MSPLRNTARYSSDLFIPWICCYPWLTIESLGQCFCSPRKLDLPSVEQAGGRFILCWVNRCQNLLSGNKLLLDTASGNILHMKLTCYHIYTKQITARKKLIWFYFLREIAIKITEAQTHHQSQSSH